ncbi:MAG: acyl-CoA dehydrogenase C-terminal domain-containing protein, partial [Hyphomicrobiales bacterium]|nr:acyl-CoA dehydrogenase C-terminal domain-containing protein [Hyphomicrobiales bacterium]
GWQIARLAMAAADDLAAGNGDADFLAGKIKSARFYMSHVMPLADAYATIIETGAEVVLDFDDAGFGESA